MNRSQKGRRDSGWEEKWTYACSYYHLLELTCHATASFAISLPEKPSIISDILWNFSFQLVVVCAWRWRPSSIINYNAVCERGEREREGGE